MRRVALILSLVLASGRVRADTTGSPLDERTRSLLAAFLRESWGGTSEYERGAFLVERSAGEPKLEAWDSKLFHQAHFAGVPPSGLIAVVHTHPRRFPRPSPQDARECVRVGLPFFVVSREAVWAVDPHDGRTVPLVESAAWWREP